MNEGEGVSFMETFTIHLLLSGWFTLPISMALAMNHIIHLDPVAAPIHILENIGAQVVMAFFCVPPAPSTCPISSHTGSHE